MVFITLSTIPPVVFGTQNACGNDPPSPFEPPVSAADRGWQQSWLERQSIFGRSQGDHPFLALIATQQTAIYAAIAYRYVTAWFTTPHALSGHG